MRDLRFHCFLVLFFNFWVLGGCTTYPERIENFAAVTPKAGKALVYLYRTPTAIHNANIDVPRFFVRSGSGQEIFVGRMVIGGFYAIEVEPGPVEIYYKNSLFMIPFWWRSQTRQVDAKVADPTYVKFEVTVGLMGEKIFFEQVPRQQGEYEIRETKSLKICKGLKSCAPRPEK